MWFLIGVVVVVIVAALVVARRRGTAPRPSDGTDRFHDAGYGEGAATAQAIRQAGNNGTTGGI